MAVFVLTTITVVIGVATVITIIVPIIVVIATRLRVRLATVVIASLGNNAAGKAKDACDRRFRFEFN